MKRLSVGLTALLAATLGLVAVPTAAMAIPAGADQATVGVFYGYDFGDAGTVVSGLPPGLTADDSDGTVAGIPTTAGVYGVFVRYPEVCNADRTQCFQDGEYFELTVAPAPAGPARADLRIEPIVLPPSVSRGSTIRVAIAANNVGPSPTGRASVVLTIPPGFTYVGTNVLGDPAPTAAKYGPFVVVSVPSLEAAGSGQLTRSRISAVVELTVAGGPRRTAFVAATGSTVRDPALANNITATLVRVS